MLRWCRTSDQPGEAETWVGSIATGEEYARIERWYDAADRAVYRWSVELERFATAGWEACLERARTRVEEVVHERG